MATGTIPYLGKQFIDLGTVDDLNIGNRTSSTISVASYLVNTANAPTTAGGTVFLFTNANANYGTQIAVNDAGMYYRKLSSTYKTWTTIV